MSPPLLQSLETRGLDPRDRPLHGTSAIPDPVAPASAEDVSIHTEAAPGLPEYAGAARSSCRNGRSFVDRIYSHDSSLHRGQLEGKQRWNALDCVSPGIEEVEGDGCIRGSGPSARPARVVLHATLQPGHARRDIADAMTTIASQRRRLSKGLRSNITFIPSETIFRVSSSAGSIAQLSSTKPYSTSNPSSYHTRSDAHFP